MYKSSGKKSKGSPKSYFSDVSYSDEELEEYDSSSLQSPDYYSTGNNKGSYYSSHQPGHAQNHSRHGKSGKNYYSPAAVAVAAAAAANNGKSVYYSTPKSSDYYRNTNNLYSLHGKHKGGKVEPAYKMNKYQTIVLKVQIHCDACIRKVKKAIADIDGVDSISVDQKQKKVSVTGYIDPKKVLKKVSKTGKSVELVGSKDSSGISHMSGGNSNNSKPALIIADHHVATTKPYTIQVDKRSQQNTAHMAPYIHRVTPQVRSDMDYMFSDDNANSCSIM
ncbi:hypothetical protein SELMODRAFT_449153 [Selaginella moellendorffii]|uniref:HMA domain-containing protein n=1 Tax=Selaginella moellendorffii TaxID=88036 RepID=D8TD53_SELML|nr:heavy metal-associated isoprenylated plant protein 28 [Selaginella moellendorffii]EFJ05420.1 hypothetical protein SELMODRAFT_449153 [Selaginella moellendorffii]|eukprot:XP_002993528.1 heavy metal-associated isoprenylated plant protein 28 [Selaginella moellendorffii]